jgi:hypothetical protein
MLLLGSVAVVHASEFYRHGEMQEIEGLDSAGKTGTTYLVRLGLPSLAAILIMSGLATVARHPGVGGGTLAAGIGTGWIARTVKNTHNEADAATQIGTWATGLDWPTFVWTLAFQAAILVVVYWAWRQYVHEKGVQQHLG